MPSRPRSTATELATALLASLEGGQILSQTRNDAASLRIAIAAALGHIRSFSADDTTDQRPSR
jgi:hypothetical protein